VFFNDELQRAFKKYASPVAFAAKPDRMTVEAAAAAVDRIVEWLENNGIGRGDRVAALTRNRMEAVLLEWAVYRIGAIWIGIPAREREAENFRHLLGDFSPSLIFYEAVVVERLYGDIFSYFDGVSYKDVTLPERFDGIRYRALRRHKSPPADVDFRLSGEPIVRIRYTSGTSGDRKAIAYTQKTLEVMFKNINELIVRGHEETMVHVTPFVWATGSLIAPVFCNGGKNVLVDPWDVRSFAHAVLEEERVLTFCVPSQVAEMTRFSEEVGAAWSKSLRRVLVPGAPTPVPIMRQAKRILPHVDFFMTLGQTEASFPITWHEVADSDLEIGRGRRPLVPLGRLTEPYRDSTVDPETGELLLVGAAVAGGKWIRPRDGVPGHFEPLERPHATGDVVERDGDGRLHYVGRKASLPERKLGWPAPDAIEAEPMASRGNWQDFDFSRLQRGPLYAYVGAGLSMGAAGLVGWNEMACLIWWYLRYYENKEDMPSCPTDPEENARFIQKFITETESPETDVRIMSRKSNDQRALARTSLLNLMLRYRAPRLRWCAEGGEAKPMSQSSKLRGRPGRPLDAEDLVFHSLVWRTGCHGVLTTNYDMLLEHAYSLFSHGADLRSYRYTADFLRYLVSNPRFVLKLHGDINDLATMEFDPNDAWGDGGRFSDGKSIGEDLKRVYGALLSRGHMIYVGCGFTDETIKRLHDSWVGGGGAARFCRVALIPVWEEEVKERFPAIEFLTYEDPDREVRQFLECVIAARSGVRESWPASLEASSLYRQIFFSVSGDPPVQRMITELWSCKGIRRG